jgi:hypothetical protein
MKMFVYRVVRHTVHRTSSIKSVAFAEDRKKADNMLKNVQPRLYFLYLSENKPANLETSLDVQENDIAINIVVS